jgi:hypothetical protein
MALLQRNDLQRQMLFVSDFSPRPSQWRGICLREVFQQEGVTSLGDDTVVVLENQWVLSAIRDGAFQGFRALGQ